MLLDLLRHSQALHHDLFKIDLCHQTDDGHSIRISNGFREVTLVPDKNHIRYEVRPTDYARRKSYCWTKELSQECGELASSEVAVSFVLECFSGRPYSEILTPRTVDASAMRILVERDVTFCGEFWRAISQPGVNLPGSVLKSPVLAELPLNREIWDENTDNPPVTVMGANERHVTLLGIGNDIDYLAYAPNAHEVGKLNGMDHAIAFCRIWLTSDLLSEIRLERTVLRSYRN